MLVSKSNLATGEIIAHPEINLMPAYGFSVGADFIAIQTRLSLKFKFTLEYEVPMSSSLGAFGIDDHQQLEFEVRLTNGELAAITPSLSWRPQFKYYNQTLYLLDLPQGRLQITGIINNQIIYEAYLVTGAQVPGRAENKLVLSDLAQSLLTAAKAPITKSVSVLAGVVKSFQELLPAKIYRRKSNRTAEPLPIDLRGNLVVGLFLLYYLYQLQAKPPAQLVSAQLSEQTLAVVVKIAQAAAIGLDLRTGLIFAEKNALVYSKPSTLCTAVAIILWHELAENYGQDQFTIPLQIAWAHRAKADFNPEIESEVEYNLGQELLAEYQIIESQEPKLVDLTINDWSPLAEIYSCLTCFLPQAARSVPYLKIPRMALANLTQAYSQGLALQGQLVQTQIDAVPTGYLWPTKNQITQPNSVWGALIRMAASSLSRLLTINRSTIATFSPTSNSSSRQWLKLLYPMSELMPWGYRQSLTEVLLKSPKFGLGSVEWLAYNLGFKPISKTLKDYEYVSNFKGKLAFNQPTVNTISLVDPEGYYLEDSDQFYPEDPASSDYPLPTQTNIFLDPTSVFGDETRLIEDDTQPLDFTRYTNSVTLKGEGDPHQLRSYLDERLPVGTKININHYTSGSASSFRKPTNTYNVTVPDNLVTPPEE